MLEVSFGIFQPDQSHFDLHETLSNFSVDILLDKREVFQGGSFLDNIYFDFLDLKSLKTSKVDLVLVLEVV